ncbi:MAG: hypothetical protein CMK74_15075 [Pseudomonadales bacterium]|nr:hypothetical protein [Pseudomonadales bacterium]
MTTTDYIATLTTYNSGNTNAIFDCPYCDGSHVVRTTQSEGAPALTTEGTGYIHCEKVYYRRDVGQPGSGWLTVTVTATEPESTTTEAEDNALAAMRYLSHSGDNLAVRAETEYGQPWAYERMQYMLDYAAPVSEHRKGARNYSLTAMVSDLHQLLADALAARQWGLYIELATACDLAANGAPAEATNPHYNPEWPLSRDSYPTQCTAAVCILDPLNLHADAIATEAPALRRDMDAIMQRTTERTPGQALTTALTAMREDAERRGKDHAAWLLQMAIDASVGCSDYTHVTPTEDTDVTPDTAESTDTPIDPDVVPATGADHATDWTTDAAVADAAESLTQVIHLYAQHHLLDALHICHGDGSKGYHVPTMLRAASDALVAAQPQGMAGLAHAAATLYDLLTDGGLDNVCYYHGHGLDPDTGNPCMQAQYIGCDDCPCLHFDAAHKVAHPQHRCSDCGLFFDSAYFAAGECPYCDTPDTDGPDTDGGVPMPTDVAVTDAVTTTVAESTLAAHGDHVVVTLADNDNDAQPKDDTEIQWAYTYQGVGRTLNVTWQHAERHLDATRWHGDHNEGRVEVGHYQALVAISLAKALRLRGYAAPSQFVFNFRSGDNADQRSRDLAAFVTDLTSSGLTVGSKPRTVPALLTADAIRCNVGWLPANTTGDQVMDTDTAQDNQ